MIHHHTQTTARQSQAVVVSGYHTPPSSCQSRPSHLGITRPGHKGMCIGECECGLLPHHQIYSHATSEAWLVFTETTTALLLSVSANPNTTHHSQRV